jgi:thymidylate synthase (FAD)
LEIETSRAIARQIIRHRSFAFSEFSQRYAEVNGDPIFVEARTQDAKNRQSSHPTNDPILIKYWSRAQADVWAVAQDWYENALKMGIAKEQARALLPEGMTPSRLYMSGTVRSWIHYIQVRSENGTQKEHSMIALECKRILKDVIPTVIEILDEEESSCIHNVDKTK